MKSVRNLENKLPEILIDTMPYKKIKMVKAAPFIGKVPPGAIMFTEAFNLLSLSPVRRCGSERYVSTLVTPKDSPVTIR
ncbi:MAG: hypothetical protein ACE5NG_19285 [bacterium]